MSETYKKWKEQQLIPGAESFQVWLSEAEAYGFPLHHPWGINRQQLNQLNRQ